MRLIFKLVVVNQIALLKVADAPPSRNFFLPDSFQSRILAFFLPSAQSETWAFPESEGCQSSD